MSTLKEIGEWWIPDQQERIYGTLTFNEDSGLLLEAVTPVSPWGVAPAVPLLWGWTGSGEAVTLMDCHAYVWNSAPLTNFKCKAQLAVIGRHVRSHELVFRRVAIEYTRLREWAAVQYFDSTDQQGAGDRITLSYKVPPSVIGLVRGGALSIKHSLSSEGGHDGPIHLTPRAFLEVSSDTEHTFAVWNKLFIRPFQNFLTLATGRPVGITSITAYIDDPHKKQSSVQILRRNVFGEKASELVENVSPDDLFTRHSLGDNWIDVIGKWFEFVDEMGPTLDAFFALSYSETMYLEHQFLTLVQVAESYSFARRGLEPPISKAEFKHRLDEILAFVPEHHRSWLEPRITPYIRKPSLNERIKDLCQLASTAVGALVPDVDSFAQSVTLTRNLITHRIHERTSQREEILSIDEMTYRLLTILRVCFLSEIGIPTAQTVRFYQQNLRFRREVARASNAGREGTYLIP